MKIKKPKKTCKKCKSKEIKRDGFMRGKQRYKCKTCGHVFQNRTRKKSIDMNKLWKEFSFGKQFYSELAERYEVSSRTIQSKLDEYEFIPPQVTPTEIILLMDTTYFGDFGIMAFKEAKSSKLIHYKIVKNENNTDYKNGVKELQKQGWTIKAIVCDGRRGVLTGFPNIPTQMCNFHQVAIIRRYITKNPILQENKDLKWISQLLVHTDKETFSYYVELFGIVHKDFLNERSQDNKGKWHYVHNRTRSAYNSLKNNLKYLFTWYDYIGKVDIPNTTNGLEGLFGNIKPKVVLHRGLKKERKIKLILTLLHGKK